MRNASKALANPNNISKVFVFVRKENVKLEGLENPHSHAELVVC